MGTGRKWPERVNMVERRRSFSLHHEKSAQKALTILRMIRRTLFRITRMDIQILYGAYVKLPLEYINQVVYSERKKNVKFTPRVQQPAAKMVTGLKFVDYGVGLAVLDLLPLEYRHLRGNPKLTRGLFKQGNRIYGKNRCTVVAMTHQSSRVSLDNHSYYFGEFGADDQVGESEVASDFGRGCSKRPVPPSFTQPDWSPVCTHMVHVTLHRPDSINVNLQV
ncbi:PCLO piccolo [Clonorchis sinensis]|uniref:PCLO piccolo n=1 Tax=Clonorchis sinensis TaxID=79923 RepID=G7Y9B6_CLOSI|nr:PCLO piccolo [Clonorchis sinensis]